MNAVLFAYRTSFHLGINNSPYLLESLRVPLDVELYRYLRENDISPNDPSFIFSHAQALHRARNQARSFSLFLSEPTCSGISESFFIPLFFT